MKEADMFGLSFSGNDITITRTTFLNITASDKYILVDVSEIFDCQGHLDDDVKKNGKFVCDRFLENTIFKPRK